MVGTPLKGAEFSGTTQLRMRNRTWDHPETPIW